MKIGVYGGTFNPPHLGHMAAARETAEALKLDKVLLVPDSAPPHKVLPEDSPTSEQRLEMAQIMADRLGKGFEASDIELARGGRSYTADTLKALSKLYPEDELYLLLGTDMFLTLDTWYKPEKICKYAHIAAFGRHKGDTECFREQKKKLKRLFGAKVKLLNLESLVEVSSTQLREKLSQGQGRELLDESIYGYILMHRLYGTNADLTNLSLEDLRACSYSMVHAKRIPHIRGTEQEAALLARKNGADEEKARKAAILHDCTKYWTDEKQLSTCEKYGILVDQVERDNTGLLHAKTGAVVAREVFGMPEDICSAIFWHTTGRAGMTLLEKILYIADYAEPSRPFEWSRELREIVEEDLDRGVLRGLEVSIRTNEARHKTVHQNGIEAYEWMKQRIENKGEEHG